MTGGETGPIPAENQPGHHPPKEQDKPDLDAFAAKLGTDPEAPTATGARKAPRTKATESKATQSKPTQSKAASRPATTAPKKSPAAPPKVEATPAKRPAAAPTSRPESAPSPEDAANLSAPRPGPEDQHEPRLVGMLLLPLRETVKGLEQLDRTLSGRLTRKLGIEGPRSQGPVMA